jgi:hypothetical protein
VDSLPEFEWMSRYSPVRLGSTRLSDDQSEHKMLITDPFFYLVAIPAVILTGISKGGFGSALGG